MTSTGDVKKSFCCQMDIKYLIQFENWPMTYLSLQQTCTTQPWGQRRATTQISEE